LYIRNGKLDTKWKNRQTKSSKENSRTALDGNISSPKHKIPTLVYSPFTFVLSENVFCQGMVVLLNQVCVLLSGMLHVYKIERRKRCIFRDSNTGFVRLKMVELFGPVFLKLREAKAEGNISYNYTLSDVLSRNSK